MKITNGSNLAQNILEHGTSRYAQRRKEMCRAFRTLGPNDCLSEEYRADANFRKGARKLARAYYQLEEDYVVAMGMAKEWEEEALYWKHAYLDRQKPVVVAPPTTIWQRLANLFLGRAAA